MSDKTHTKIGRVTKILSIDPGPVQSGYVTWDGHKIYEKGILENDKMLLKLDSIPRNIKEMVIEQVRSYGMPVGATVFDTVFWTGRFCQAWHGKFSQVPRLLVKQYLCHNSRAKDSNIIQALVDRFAYGQKNRGKGTKKENGFFYGFKSDIWQAFALAVMWWDLKNTAMTNNDN